MSVRLGSPLLALILWGIGNGFAWAQTIIATPSLTISEEYDDNITLTSKNPLSDFISAARPALSLEVKDHPWYVTLAGSLRGELFASHSELNNYDNQDGRVSIEFRPERPFSLSLTDTFVRSTNPATVAPEAGIATGRFTAISNAITPAATYQFNPRTGIRLQYSFRILRSDSANARDSDTHEATAALQHRFTPRTSGDISYTFSRFLVEGSAERDSHSPRLGLVFAYSPTVKFVSSTGLLFLEQEDGSQEVTLASSTRYEQAFRQGGFSIGYERNAGVAGLTGVTSVSQGITAAANYQPIRNLTLALDASLTETKGSGSAPTDSASTGSAPTRTDFLTFLGSFRISYRLLRWLSVEASYRYQRQDDRAGSQDLQKNVFFLGLTASDQFRIR